MMKQITKVEYGYIRSERAWAFDLTTTDICDGQREYLPTIWIGNGRVAADEQLAELRERYPEAEFVKV